MSMTAEQIAQQAVETVIKALPYPRAQLEQMSIHQLPCLTDKAQIFGPARDNAAVMEEYPADWTGMAVSSSNGYINFWLIFHCEYSKERALACLGAQPSVSAAIDTACLRVEDNIRTWSTLK